MRIRRAVIDAVVGHARREDPMECCGLLIGAGDDVLESRPARNLRQSRTAYLVDPEDHFAAIRAARAAGLAVVGGYHSHPRSIPVPSVTDIAEATDPEFLYVIVSLAATEPEIAAYRIRSGVAFPFPISHFP
ncbi:MAG: M67 family metallopeptidase [Vicinamibacterales bacterium]